MKAYRTYLIVTDPKQVVIPDVPFQAGQVVEVLLLARDEEQRSTTQRLDALFQTTQTLPQAHIISDDDIAAEIEAYRNGQ